MPGVKGIKKLDRDSIVVTEDGTISALSFTLACDKLLSHDEQAAYEGKDWYTGADYEDAGAFQEKTWLAPRIKDTLAQIYRVFPICPASVIYDYGYHHRSATLRIIVVFPPHDDAPTMELSDMFLRIINCWYNETCKKMPAV